MFLCMKYVVVPCYMFVCVCVCVCVYVCVCVCKIGCRTTYMCIMLGSLLYAHATQISLFLYITGY